MSPQLSREQAAAALAEVEAARASMRRVVREHRGHYHLWIWGAVWIAMPLTAHFGGDQAARHFWWITIIGGVLSALTGFTQSRQIRRPANLRFVGVMVTMWVFAATFPLVLRPALESRGLYAFCCLVAMQTYVVAGLWTDTYLLWVGLLVAALVLVGFFCFPGIFWLWMAVFGGGTLVATGFYVLLFWK